MTCQRCKGAMMVCEFHPDKPWTPSGCECGAGMPCPVCRPQRFPMGDEAFAEVVHQAIEATAKQMRS
jgi:hypothetical protein